MGQQARQKEFFRILLMLLFRTIRFTLCSFLLSLLASLLSGSALSCTTSLLRKCPGMRWKCSCLSLWESAALVSCIGLAAKEFIIFETELLFQLLPIIW